MVGTGAEILLGPARIIAAGDALDLDIIHRGEGIGQPERVEDFGADELLVRIAQRLVEDIADQQVIGVGILIARAGLEIGGLVKHQRQIIIHFARGDGPAIRVLDPVGNAAPVLQHHAQRDALGIGELADKVGEEIRDRVIEIEPAIGDQHRGRRGDIEFGNAGNLEQIVRIGGYLQVAVMPAGGIEFRLVTGAVDIDDDAVEAVVGSAIDLRLDRRRQRHQITDGGAPGGEEIEASNRRNDRGQSEKPDDGGFFHVETSLVSRPAAVAAGL